MDYMVSIITPVYNGEKYIKETIESVRSQTYPNWEMIIVDDISTDHTVSILAAYAAMDLRIKYYVLDEKGGASIARNKAISVAKGEYIAFLDADDVWKEDKLHKQLEFMTKNQYDFSFHNYDLIDDDSSSLHIRRLAPDKLTYERALIGCSIGCLSVMYNAKKIGMIQIPRIDKRNDDALWFAILERCRVGYCLNESLAFYRISCNSLSSGNKLKLIRHHYHLYRVSRNFNPLKSSFYVFTNIIVYFNNKRKREVRI